MGQRKQLKHRLKNRGHGTLGSEDCSDVAVVNLKNIDINDRSIRKNFGKLGQLPNEPRQIGETNVKLTRNNNTITNTVFLKPGKYQLYIQLEKPSDAVKKYFFSKMCKLHVKAWLIGSSKKFANFRTDTYLHKKRDLVRLKFEVTEKDCTRENAELQMVLTSQSRLASCRVTTSLFELSEGYCM